MARNSEKAQSMLYRFRETQAAELGLANRVRGERRPRMASAVTNLRECERWRGDILKEISRKVSKIQDATLTDYEVRDLNDEINQLMREKRHWESQIVNLGGANYKRGNVSMTDDDGREVPGTRGYKYFGRARELPGVKEMFAKGAQQATEESARTASFQMFRNQGPEYYGDADEMDEQLAKEEEELARLDWEQAAIETAQLLSIEDTDALPPFPSSSSSSKPPHTSAADEKGVNGGAGEKTKGSGKRRASTTSKGRGKKSKTAKGKKAAEAEAEEDEHAVEDGDEGGEGEAQEVNGAAASAVDGSANARAAAMAASFLGMLDAESLKHPTMPTREEMGKVLLEVRKKALREEYGV